jgi:HAE1 family hydrophobic/amphiphilic exporter-1
MLGVMIGGVASFQSMSVDLFPNVDVPVVAIITVYPGAGPEEIETLVSRPLEEQISSIAGLKRLSSKNLEGISQVVAEFKSGVNADRAEQQVRDKVNLSRGKMPTEIEEPIIRRFDPSDQPVLILALTADLPQAKMFDLADQFIKPRFEQVNNVGAVEIYGGRKREVQVLLDRNKLREKEMSVSQIAAQIGASGENIPGGKVNIGAKELSFRGLGEFESVPQISDILINLYGNEVPTKVGAVGKVIDTMVDEKNRTFIDGKSSLFMFVYRQSGTNTIKVADDAKSAIEKINAELAAGTTKGQLQMVIDGSKMIRDNVYDVYETIVIAIILTVLTVFFFLGDLKITLITALALPISMIGAFNLMGWAGFSINIVSLIALSLAVGLLVDDAIVIVENIHKRMKEGREAKAAAEFGTNELQLSVFAITLVVVAVFVPVGFMQGTIGQFLKEFGLTMAFSMMISFIVALTLIPMLSAYFVSSDHDNQADDSLYSKTIGAVLRWFDRFQTKLENGYGRLLELITKRPIVAFAGSLAVFALGIVLAQKVPSAFLPEMDNGQIVINFELAPGTSLDGTQEVAEKIEKIVKSHSNIALAPVIVGGFNGEANKGQLFVLLKSGKERGGTTAQFKEVLRNDLKEFAHAKLVVKDYDVTGGMAGQPIILNLVGSEQKQVQEYAAKLVKFMQADKRIKDVESDARDGKPEFSIKLRPESANTYGINSKTMGVELRGQVEGFTPAKFREDGKEYDVRVRLEESQRNLKDNYAKVLVPNVNHKLVRLSDIAEAHEVLGPAEINRLDRGRSVQIQAGVASGVGLGNVSKDIEKYLNEGENKLPPGMRYNWAGDVENSADLGSSAVLAVGFAVVLIYLILCSLYASFVTPVTILSALPLALSGAFYALFIANEVMSIFAILGIFLLLGVSGKNSILLVDFANQMMGEGKSRTEAIIAAGKARLRPILMTSFALIAGTMPIAIGLNEASKMRTAMGWAIVGGLISSTLLTLIVVPAIFSYVDRYRVWSKGLMAKIFLPKETHGHSIANGKLNRGEESVFQK